VAYVPTTDEMRRLRRAIDLASFREGERIAWLVSFSCVLMLGVGLLFWGDLDDATLGAVSIDLAYAGLAGFLGGFIVLYWRLRAGHLARSGPGELRHLFGVGIRSREQRAFTALMLRHAFTGNNPLAQRVQHRRVL